jgi:2'-5' RNA ligase
VSSARQPSDRAAGVPQPQASGDRPRHRLFFALVPPPAVLADIGLVADELRQQQARGRPVRSEQWHLTLAFLGDFAEADAPERARRAGAEASASAHPFDVVLDRIASFPGARPPWFLTGDAAPILPLQSRLVAALQAAGLEPKDAGRVFVPHVTLLRNAHGPLPPTPIAPITWPAREFVLIDSGSAERGYVTLQRWALDGPA